MNENVRDADKKIPSKKFKDASKLLSDPKALREKATNDGYLFFKGLLPKDKVLGLRKDILELLNKRGWVDTSNPLIDGIANTSEVEKLSAEQINAFGAGIPGIVYEVYRDIQKLESFHALAHEPNLLKVYQIIFDNEPFVHPRNIARVMLPSSKLNKTPSHQDYLHVQGAAETWTCWAPLGDCPTQLGGLSILEGSHKAGVLGVTQNPGAGGLESILCDLGYEWVIGDYEIGDLVTFHSHTVHKALPQLSKDRIRLSVDFRYQALNQPIEERSLYPHAGYEWEDIYEGWTREDLQYYWKDKSLEIKPWDESIRWQKDKIC